MPTGDDRWVWGRSLWGVDTIWAERNRMDDQQVAAYDRARVRVLDAAARLAEAEEKRPSDVVAAKAEFAAAHDELREATAPLSTLVEKAWDVNVDVVQDAKMAVQVAATEQTRVEVECGNAARARNPARPVLSGEELARCDDVQAATFRAREWLEGVQARFKAGVTADQLVEVDVP